jgi:hypothetical protein
MLYLEGGIMRPSPLECEARQEGFVGGANKCERGHRKRLSGRHRARRRLGQTRYCDFGEEGCYVEALIDDG